MAEAQIRARVKAFVDTWRGRGYEKGESQPFWLALLRDVCGVDNPESFISFEERVDLGHTSFIDAYIPSSKVLIEQKSAGKDLRKAIRQSDGTMLTPFEQAKRYAVEMGSSRYPRWIVVSNFEEILIYDMDRPRAEPQSVLVADLGREYHRLRFLVDADNDTTRREMELSLKAGDLVGRLYDLLLAQYHDPSNAHSLKSLNKLCVRLVFCLYAEDAGVFGRRDMFVDYLREFRPENVRMALIALFKVLDTPIDRRDPYMNASLLEFPYVNGGLFSDVEIEIPSFTPAIVELIEQECSLDFDWSGISPTIFGGVFESTLNPATRRQGGMHYTSIENIHKVIDPLFLNDLTAELTDICAMRQPRQRNARLKEFRLHLASLRFLDPACGSGNFLTETYLSLRRLENRALKEMRGNDSAEMNLGAEHSPILVSINQFYGIEINDFAATVAKTAMWISEAQMQRETEDIIQADLDYLPLRDYDNIVEADALAIDWADVIPVAEVGYIIGNPPFVGARNMDAAQKQGVIATFGPRWKNVGNLDLVCAWYKKAADYMRGTVIKAALVSTNSLCQGETVANLWKPLMAEGLRINFAHRTFRWDSESNRKAHVHCVIVGFSYADTPRKTIYTDGLPQAARHINAYLLDGGDVFVEKRSKPICDVPEMNYGSFALDDGNYTISNQEFLSISQYCPLALPYLKPFIGAKELLHSESRYCVWLKNADPSIISHIPIIKNKIARVRQWRSESSRKNTRLLADFPMLFAEIRQPDTEYVAIPTVSSEKREYIPIAYLTPDIIGSNQIYILPSATLYHFGVLTSSVHNAWMRAVCGRLEMRYRYSKDVVYNNLPWPEPDDAQRSRIEATAHAILDARAIYPDCSLADLYDPSTMPPELRRAHRDNDHAVLSAYGLPADTPEAAIVASLMELYTQMT